MAAEANHDDAGVSCCCCEVLKRWKDRRDLWARRNWDCNREEAEEPNVVSPRHSDVEAALRMSQGHRWRARDALRAEAGGKGNCMSSAGGTDGRKSARSDDDWSLTVVLAVATGSKTAEDSGLPDWARSHTSNRIWIYYWDRHMHGGDCIGRHRVAGRCYRYPECHARGRGP